MNDELEDQLRARGSRYHAIAGAVPRDLGDVDGRSRRQRRSRRRTVGLATAAAVAALAVVPLVRAERAAGVRTLDFRLLAYPADTCAESDAVPSAPPTTLIGGLPERPSPFPTLVDASPVAYGDVTADGREDAVVLVTCLSDSTRVTFTRLWVFAAEDHAPGGVRRLAAAPELPASAPGTRTARGLAPSVVTPVIVDDGALVARWSVPAPAPDPTLVTVRHTWTGTGWRNELVAEAPTPATAAPPR